VTRMPDIEGALGAVEGFAERILHHHDQAATETAAREEAARQHLAEGARQMAGLLESLAPVTEPINQEEHPVFDFTPAKNALERVEHIGEDVLAMAERFAATPEGTALLAVAHAIVAAEDPALLATATTIAGALVPRQPAAVAAPSAVTNQG